MLSKAPKPPAITRDKGGAATADSRCCCTHLGAMKGLSCSRCDARYTARRPAVAYRQNDSTVAHTTSQGDIPPRVLATASASQPKVQLGGNAYSF